VWRRWRRAGWCTGGGSSAPARGAGNCAINHEPDRLVTLFNARAVTLYLWHEIALILAVPLIDQFWNVPAFEKHLPLESQWFMFGVGWILIAVFVLLAGWVEDMAAKKKPKLVPGGRTATMGP
jgi:hypothetical protein